MSRHRAEKRRRPTGRDWRFKEEKLPDYNSEEVPPLEEGRVYVHEIHDRDVNGIVVKPPGHPFVVIKGYGMEQDPRFNPGNFVGYMLVELGHGIGYGRLVD